MSETTLKTRLILNNKTEKEWSSSGTFVPLSGEICIYSDLKKIKIGDGSTTVANLSFINLTPQEVETLLTSIQDELDSHVDNEDIHFTTAEREKLGSIDSAGSATQPVYFKNGKPVAGTYSLNKTVPSDAVFTDTNTHYTSKNVVGTKTDTSNTTTTLTNGNVYLNSVENGAVTSSNKISGSGATTVTTDTSGNIVVSSTDTTYNSAGSSLGLVKSGGDVTISSGVITVNDDSHNHTIANIDNLQSTLDAKVPSSRTVNGKALSANISLTASDVGADSLGTASSTVSTHNTSTSAHSDIRNLISDLTTKLNNFLDTDDTTADQLSELIELINTNKTSIAEITSNKVNVSDIVNNLTTNSSSKVLSAAQGVAIKSLIDALQTTVDGKASSGHTHSNYASTVTTTGSGNAITAISQTGNTITATKGSTFLTAHPTISTNTDTTTTGSPAHGGTFTAIDSVTRDGNGHVAKVNTKTVTLPSETTLTKGTNTTATASPAHGGTFTAITGLAVSGHTITPTVTTYTLPTDNNTDTKMTQAYGTTNASYPLLMCATSGVSSTSSRGATTGIVNNSIYANPSTGTITATTFSGALSGNASTATKLATARTISLTGSVTGSGSFDGSGNLSIATTTNHTHSYLPLAGGTLTGALTINSDLTLSGNITIKNSASQFIAKQTDITRGTAPSADQFTKVVNVYDSAGISAGGVEHTYRTNCVNKMGLIVYPGTSNSTSTNAQIAVGFDENGNAYTYAQTPAIDDSSTNIATTRYVTSRINITNKTLDLNSLTLSSGAIHIQRYIENTSGGSANISNLPVTNAPFILDVELIRWASTTDYITKQTYRNVSESYTYERRCTSGTWGNWVKRGCVTNDTLTCSKVTIGNAIMTYNSTNKALVISVT